MAGGRDRAAPFVDQHRKLRYLVEVRGDRRRPDPKQLDYADGETVMRLPSERQSPIVTNQTKLADALNMDLATVSRWINGHVKIPDRELREICWIFRIDDLAFRTLEHSAFVTACEATAPKHELAATSPRWRDLVQQAPDGSVQILLSDPFAATMPGKLRYARLGGEGPKPAAQIPAETRFWLEISSPLETTGRALWRGWHILLFNHDIAKGGFMCLLPRHRSHPMFAPALFPIDRAHLFLPRRQWLDHAESEQGDFEMVVVLTVTALPDALVDDLSIEYPQGLAIEAPLQALAAWLVSSCAADPIAIRKILYRVIRNTEPVLGK